MSAYIVDLNHVAYLVQAGTSCALGMARVNLSWTWNIDRKADTNDHAKLSPGDLAQAQRVGQMLWDENVKSVRHRYGNLLGPCDCYVYPNHVPMFDDFDPVQVIKACNCYAYQACEHDGWPESEAKAYTDALRAYACASLPGYEDAAWGAPRRLVRVC
jgi:hypothetical protein